MVKVGIQTRLENIEYMIENEVENKENIKVLKDEYKEYEEYLEELRSKRHF